jgi:hypothetical protein
VSRPFPYRPLAKPTIYAYSDEERSGQKGLLKVGFTAAKTAAERVAEQYGPTTPGTKPWIIEVDESAMRRDGTYFVDHDVRAVLRANGVLAVGREWMRCTPEQVKAAIKSVREGTAYEAERDLEYKPRPEQQLAIDTTAEFFALAERDGIATPKFLWNAKMRFGKTFATYQLAKKMGWTRILILTYRPAVEASWGEDLRRHKDFDGWRFVSQRTLAASPVDVNLPEPLIYFGSYQDLTQPDATTGGQKPKHDWIRNCEWDCLVVDETHHGAWRRRAKVLNESLKVRHTLHLSGTPFRQLSSGEFEEAQIFTWTYTDEQTAKATFTGDGLNPYADLPRMVLLTHQLPEVIRKVANRGEFNEFDLNAFFATTGSKEDARFVHENEVQQWLNYLRGGYDGTFEQDLRQRGEKTRYPYKDATLLEALTHTLWLLPDVASCYAMKELLQRRNNRFYRDYEVVVAAGNEAGMGIEALEGVEKAMAPNPLETKTITLSCQKLTTGVTVRPWAGIFMLHNSASPEKYFQAAFRVQSPWTVDEPDENQVRQQVIIKPECYVLDFAPNRALRLIADYAERLDSREPNWEKKVNAFLKFLPVFSADGGSMTPASASDILDVQMLGVSGEMLKRQWEHSSLIDVADDALDRLVKSESVMAALERISGRMKDNAITRSEIKVIVNRTDGIAPAQGAGNDGGSEDTTATQEEEAEKAREAIRKKLRNLATRVPLFMYLTDHRERTLDEVLNSSEPHLFAQVLEMSNADFASLVELGIFRRERVNEVVRKFRKFEGPSLRYLGVSTHLGVDTDELPEIAPDNTVKEN